MKIAYCIKTRNDLNQNRGVGTYTNKLYEALIKLNNSGVTLLEFENKIPNDADLVHYPFFEPFFLTLPLFKSKPTVVTVHDLTPLVFPKRFPRGIRGEIKWQLQKTALKSTAAIITDSENSKKDIHKIINYPNRKISSISLAPSGNYQMVEDNAILKKVKTKYGLPDDFVLYVGDVGWNKNVSGLLQAFNRIKNYELRIKKNIKLVLVGKALLNNNLPEVIEINKTIKSLGLEKDVIKTGFIDDSDMAAIYTLAKAYVQPSFYEGFGLPVLDAMMCGCPVVSSNASSLPEVGGNAVVYFDPNNIDEMTGKINTILQFNNAAIIKLRNKQYQQAKLFSWEKTAEETMKVYKISIKYGNGLKSPGY